MPVPALGLSAPAAKPHLAKDINPTELDMKLLWIPQIPVAKGPFPDGKAPGSTRIQVAALIQSWSRQAALSSLPNRNKMFMQHSSNRSEPREASQALEFSEHFATCRFGRNLGRVLLLLFFFLPWQKEFFQCQGDHTSEYSCTGFCSFSCFSLLWQCPSPVLPAGAARKERVKCEEQKIPKRAAPTRFPHQYLQEGGSTPGSSFKVLTSAAHDSTPRSFPVLCEDLFHFLSTWLQFFQ